MIDVPCHMQADRLEEIVPRNFLGAGDIRPKEPTQVSVAERFGGLPYPSES